METISLERLPTHFLEVVLWFATLVGGTGLLASGLMLSNPEHRFDDALGIALYVGLFATIFSLPTLLILPFGMHWAFRATTIPSRWARLLLVVSGSFGLVAGCGCWFVIITGLGLHGGLLFFMAPYLPAAWLAAIIIYRPWLFRA